MNYNNILSIEASWVVGVFTGEQAKVVQANAHAGIGYIVLDSGGKGDNMSVKAAFRYAHDEPLPPHLLEIKDYREIDKLEQRRKDRQGIVEN